MHGVRAKFYTGSVPAGQSIPNNTFAAVKYNFVGGGFAPTSASSRRCYDTDGYHPILTNANLTGTVAKTAGNMTIVGTGTAFLSELAIGYPVNIPGGETYYPDVVIVSGISDNTHFTCYSAPQFTASGATAVKDSTVFAVPVGFAGYYAGEAYGNYRSGGGTIREVNVVYNGFDKGAGAGSNNNVDETAYLPPVSGSEQSTVIPWGPVYMNEGDYVQLFVYQDSGGAIDIAADLVGYPFSMWRCGTL